MVFISIVTCYPNQQCRKNQELKSQLTAHRIEMRALKRNNIYSVQVIAELRRHFNRVQAHSDKKQANSFSMEDLCSEWHFLSEHGAVQCAASGVVNAAIAKASPNIIKTMEKNSSFTTAIRRMYWVLLAQENIAPKRVNSIIETIVQGVMPGQVLEKLPKKSLLNLMRHEAGLLCSMVTAHIIVEGTSKQKLLARRQNNTP